jgi:hypothetical protein
MNDQKLSTDQLLIMLGLVDEVHTFILDNYPSNYTHIEDIEAACNTLHKMIQDTLPKSLEDSLDFPF